LEAKVDPPELIQTNFHLPKFMMTKVHFSILVALLSLSLTAQENYCVKELEKLADNFISEYQSLLDATNKNRDLIKDMLDKEWFMMSGTTVYRFRLTPQSYSEFAVILQRKK